MQWVPENPLKKRLDTEVMESEAPPDWIAKEEEEEHEFPIEYTIITSPNDFNVKTLFDFVESGTVKLPGFQRNFVWDIKKASRLIESIIMGLPVPQLFFYQRARNEFLVIDGQQRLMTIYYFVKGRFPREEVRPQLRRMLDERGAIPPDILSSNAYFADFALKLGAHFTGAANRLDGLTYAAFDDTERSDFNIRTIRTVVITQRDPKDNDSSMYEIFYRLNTGGVNLTPQEIRMSLYYSKFYDMLNIVNLDDRWRRLTREEPDLHKRDVEILLRGFAILTDLGTYKPPMVRFLNTFSEKSKKFSDEEISYYRALLEAFLEKCKDLPPQAFTSQFGRFSTSMYEAIFTSACEDAFANRNTNVKPVNPDRLETLKHDGEFIGASQFQTTSKSNVELRLRKAREILFP